MQRSETVCKVGSAVLTPVLMLILIVVSYGIAQLIDWYFYMPEWVGWVLVTICVLALIYCTCVIYYAMYWKCRQSQSTRG